MGTQYTNDSRGRKVNVTTWCLLVVAILAGLARLGPKYQVFHRLAIDDYFIIGSLVCVFGRDERMTVNENQAFAIARAIVISLAVASGYGKHRYYVSDPNFELVMKVCHVILSTVFIMADHFGFRTYGLGLYYAL